jgi:hypothetical protein
MYLRACLLALLLASPAWSQEPGFDLRSDAIRKIVSETAASLYVHVRLADKAPVAAEPDVLEYEPPAKPPVPVRRAPARPSRPLPEDNGFLSAVFEILFEELLGTGDGIDDITFSNLMLKCRVQNEFPPPPGPDLCPEED